MRLALEHDLARSRSYSLVRAESSATREMPGCYPSPAFVTSTLQAETSAAELRILPDNKLMLHA